MEIAAMTRYKHGGIFRALRKLGWPQIELSRRVGFAVGDFINMRRRPSESRASKIQEVFGKEGIYVDVLGAWPEDFKMKNLPVIVTYGEVDVHRLEEKKPLPIESVEQLEIALDAIPEHMCEILEDIYIRGATPSQIAATHGVSRQTVQNWLLKAKRTARDAYGKQRSMDERPGLAKYIRPYCIPDFNSCPHLQ